MQIKRFERKEEVALHAAELILNTVAERPDAVLGLATGSTPIGIYEKMVESYRRRSLSFRSVTTFNLDEYAGLPASHEQSYASYMTRHLFGHTDFDPSRTHIPNGDADDPAAECAAYDELLRKHPIDLQLLGLGHNGHIGFNEPGSALAGGTHVVELKLATREANARFFTAPSKVPARAITMGIGSILKSRAILLVVTGPDKAEIVRESLAGPITTACPASLLQTHANVTVLLDRDAGRKLNDVIGNGVHSYNEC
ncbi:glucosamine-6-phosphate deaminase [Paenibacillus darwinianus]|uniref:Glucosamine-6-phosphate deaminase n=1 Tax=Paenibacillus darwinianus TaxID=1380763 RepID=A0A9W5W7D1_9BACL|nr:glucosamine-6-phosphate deaminase [Paenibacillus darwinianus]EXX89400.1 glucosamine-6-phosphate deaminase [Paenibacillus darwinianus]EXX90180.1 glucosamine-6-phosphate deaminase [Paenibacillus darwinianus]EXX91538.1 glucosamine-6-phosphate deaminase [Paenibacillus darwinianus]